jgi:hypothetical protein
LKDFGILLEDFLKIIFLQGEFSIILLLP